MEMSFNLCVFSSLATSVFCNTESCYEAFMFYSHIVSGEREDAFWMHRDM